MENKFLSEDDSTSICPNSQQMRHNLIFKDEIWPHFTMGYLHNAAEKRLFSIKNVVINLDSATIKWNGQFTNYHGKNR